MLAGAAAAAVIAWLGAVYLIDDLRFVVFNPRGKTGFEVFLALGQLFGGLVLLLSSTDPDRSRMRWLASALMVLGIGALGFGYILPLFEMNPNPNVTMYGSLAVRATATSLTAIGLVPKHAPAFTRRILAIVLVGGLLGTIVIARIGDDLPMLVRATDMEALIATTALQSFPGLTGWHLGLGLIPLITAMAACWGSLRYVRGQSAGHWLVIAIVLFAGAQLHALFWPSMYSSVLTTTSLLRFGLTMVIISGGIVELRRLSVERAALLAEEQKRVRQLEELGRMKRDFTSMVAHELASPLAAISNMAQMISLGILPVADQQKIADRIQGEVRILQILVRDIRTSAEVERDDFTVERRPTSLRNLFDDAEAYGNNVLRGHDFSVEPVPDTQVLADPERIGQVIRNLLNNASRHTPAGTRIMLRAVLKDGLVHIEVEDNGPGINPDDQARILEKFGRGRDAGEGRGLGLYLSRRILEAHDTDLLVDSTPGSGSRFGFDLEAAPGAAVAEAKS
jgi:signal transduction histidine kinase